MRTISIERLRELFIYSPETGIIANRVNRRYRATIGMEAGNKTARGYREVKVGGTSIRAHWIAWALHFGEWPERCLDHINGIKDDNRISNLRLATRSENMQNCKTKKDNTSGFKGVYWHKGSRRWAVRIQTQGKRRHVGHFSNIEEAARAYRAAAEKFHGEFANVGGANFRGGAGFA